MKSISSNLYFTYFTRSLFTDVVHVLKIGPMIFHILEYEVLDYYQFLIQNKLYLLWTSLYIWSNILSEGHIFKSGLLGQMEYMVKILIGTTKSFPKDGYCNSHFYLDNNA